MFPGCETEQEVTETDWVAETFAGMTEDQKVGQLFCLTVYPIRYFLFPDYKENVNRVVAKYKPGAIFLSANLDTVKLEIRNEFNGNKLHDELINLQHLTDIPFFIAANFESGAWYWDSNATRFPFPLALAAAGSGEFAYRQGKITAVEAKAQGINWLFSPLVNIAIPPEMSHLQIQSLGSNPALVSDLSSQFITGCQEVGVAACLKYFPSEIPNSILSMSAVEPDDAQMNVFRDGIAAGALSIMTSPIVPPGGSTGDASPGEQHMMHDYLTNRLGFDGIIISELTTANSIDNAVEEMETVLGAIEGGSSMFILPDINGLTIPLLDILMSEAVSGNVDMATVDASVRKILDIKFSLNIHLAGRQQALRSMAGIGLPEYNQNALDVSNQGITLLKNYNNILPVDFNDSYVVSLAFLGESFPHFSTIYGEKVSQISNSIKHINIFGIPDERIQREVIRRATDADVLLCSFFYQPDKFGEHATLEPELVALMKRVAKINDQIIVVSFIDPYLINELPDVQSYIIPFSPSEHSMETTLGIIFGKSGSKGILPIYISEQFPMGHSLTTGIETKTK